MKLGDVKKMVAPQLYEVLRNEGITELRPAQSKSINKGLLKRKNLLVCTPTASGKTLVAEIAMMQAILSKQGKCIYVVPLKALAQEKFKDFKKKYGKLAKIALSIGDLDSSDSYLERFDIIITTSEKLDSLMRHHVPWVLSVATLIVDEIHLLNDPSRGPTLEIMLTMLREKLPTIQLIALSATIGNPEELADWLEAELILDDWRPVKLKKGILMQHDLEFV